ncbi:MAG: hypothetical protein LBV12_01435 [Puniceicoccales bacterium]|jgi:hypothetical protein|nr:hypothetical protein [Puniceicoccales bacterium]
MQSYQVIRNALDKGAPKQIASDLNVSLSLVYKWAEPSDGKSGTVNPLERAAQLHQATGDPEIIHWLCKAANGYFIPESGDHVDTPLNESVHKLVGQFAGLLGEIAQAASDNHISREEAIQLRRLWDSLRTATEGFVRGCEKGDFVAIRENLQNTP